MPAARRLQVDTGLMSCVLVKRLPAHVLAHLGLVNSLKYSLHFPRPVRHVK